MKKETATVLPSTSHWHFERNHRQGQYNTVHPTLGTRTETQYFPCPDWELWNWAPQWERLGRSSRPLHCSYVIWDAQNGYQSEVWLEVRCASTRMLYICIYRCSTVYCCAQSYTYCYCRNLCTNACFILLPLCTYLSLSNINLAFKMVFHPIRPPHSPWVPLCCSEVHGWWGRSHSSTIGKQPCWFHGYLLQAHFNGCILAGRTDAFGLSCPHLCPIGVILCIHCNLNIRRLGCDGVPWIWQSIFACSTSCIVKGLDNGLQIFLVEKKIYLH